MPDAIPLMTYRQRLEAIAANFERREKISRPFALLSLKSDLDALWRLARDEEMELTFRSLT